MAIAKLSFLLLPPDKSAASTCAQN
jgi:hypothetical protein